MLSVNQQHSVTDEETTDRHKQDAAKKAPRKAAILRNSLIFHYDIFMITCSFFCILQIL